MVANAKGEFECDCQAINTQPPHRESSSNLYHGAGGNSPRLQSSAAVPYYGLTASISIENSAGCLAYADCEYWDLVALVRSQARNTGYHCITYHIDVLGNNGDIELRIALFTVLKRGL